MRLQRSLRVAAGIAAVTFAAQFFADEVVTLPTRPGVTQSYLLVPPRGAAPKVIALMFPGSFGQLHLPTDGTLPKWGRGGNFLVRTRDIFRDDDVGVAILDAPSDHQREGLTDGVRLSSEHVEDVRAVVRDLRTRYSGAKIMLVGTSRGTLSAAYAGRAMGSDIDGVIETSSLFKGSGGRGGSSSLGNFDWDAIKVPLLFVHHESDACASCPYSWAKHLSERYPLITVRGGSAPESDPCEAMSAHGYIGKEAETVAAIKDWMLGRPYPQLVE
jgi:hypothetical protein